VKPSYRAHEAVFEQIVDAYIRHRRPDKVAEMQALRRLRHLDVAILDAVLVSPKNGKKYSHQWRIQEEVLRIVQAKLQAAKSKFTTARDFDALHAIKEGIGSLRGVADLAIYDFALRIGAYLRIEPKLVYLHQGSAEGARLLGFEGKTLDPKELPAAFSRLTPAEIEDCLCIYKSDLAHPIHDRRDFRPASVA
jgi:hypothetical protein